MVLIWALINPLTFYLQLPVYSSVLGFNGPRSPFDWYWFISQLVSFLLHGLAAYILLRWLYLQESPENGLSVILADDIAEDETITSNDRHDR
jgi:hypothetical protein